MAKSITQTLVRINVKCPLNPQLTEISIKHILNLGRLCNASTLAASLVRSQQ